MSAGRLNDGHLLPVWRPDMDWLSGAKQAIAEEERAAVEGNAPQELPWTRRVVLTTLRREAEAVLSENGTPTP